MKTERGQKPTNLRDGGIEYRAGRSKAPEERQHAREFVAYYRGDEVYCKRCFPRGSSAPDRDEFERMWVDWDHDESDLDFLPTCLTCGREFPDYMDTDAYRAAFAMMNDIDDDDGRFLDE